MSNNSPVVNLFCDGACSGNPGSGGWAAIAVSESYVANKIISGSSPAITTNNRMELTAAIEGLQLVCRSNRLLIPSLTHLIKVYSDSTYLVHTMSKGWQRNVNNDLWEKLDAWNSLYNIEWQWLKRNSTPELIEVDRLANLQAQGKGYLITHQA